MYLQFYHLTRPPFQLATDLDFFRKGKNYDQSFDVLKYSLEHHGGLSLLTGAAGSGKSMVVRALLNALGNSVRAGVIPDSSLTGQEFYDLVAHEFDLAAGMESREDFHDRIHVLLQEAGKNNQQVLLVVDEAQQLSRELIDEISELINLEPVDSGGLGICLVGQANTAQDLGARVSQAFENHVIVRYHFAPFTADETGKYVRHRLEVAGADRMIFTDDAIRELHRSSGGYPGQINIICDLALFTGYTENAAEIGPAIIQASAAKLQFPGMQEKPGDTCSAVTPADPETENERHVPAEKINTVPAAAAGGRSFVLPALAVLMALAFVGGGYALYLKRGAAQLTATPAIVDLPPVVDTTVPPAQESGKEQVGFDAVGYSPPREEDFSRQQPVTGKTTTIGATDTASVPAQDAGESGTPAPEFSQDRLEVQALQVEERLSTIPVAEEVSTSEPVDADTWSPQSVPTAVVEEAVVETETVLEQNTVEPTPAADQVATAQLVDVETPPLQETIPAAVTEESAAETETVPEQNTVEVSVVEPVVEPAGKQQPAMAAETPVAETGQEMEKHTDAPMNRGRKPELEHFFEVGAFVPQASSSPRVIKTTQHARTVGASPKKEKKIKIEPTAQPDPEDVIDWLLKKKEQHAQ